MKNVNIEVDSSCGTLGLPAELLSPAFSPHTWVANEFNAFAIIAIATSPPVHIGFTLADTWAHKRYLAALHSGADLRLRKEWGDIDSHQKTILADDFGVGFPLLYLQEKLELTHLSPTGWWLKALEKSVGKPIAISKKKNGPPKLPDYVCVDSSGYLHAIENKGTQTSRKALDAQIAAGVTQVENLRASALVPGALGWFRSWMVGGMFIPQNHSKKNATIVLADPDFSDLLELLSGAGGLQRAQKGIRLVGLCQQLNSIGLHRLGSALFTGQVDGRNRSFLRGADDANEEVNFMGFNRTGTAWVRNHEFRTFVSPTTRAASGPKVFNLRYSIDADVLTKLIGCITATGKVAPQILDSVLDGLAPLPLPDAGPSEKFLDLRGQMRKSKDRLWIAGSENGTSYIETPFRIRYETSVVAG